MGRLQRILHEALGGIAGAVFAVTVGLLPLAFSDAGQGLKNLSYDALYALRKDIPNDEVVLVYMDDDSHDKLNQPYNAAWDRSLHARLLERLQADGAKAVAFDIVFSGPSTNAVGDQRLAKAIKDFGKVVLAADRVMQDVGRKEVRGSQIVVPYDPFLEAAAGIGLDEMKTDADEAVRQELPVTKSDLVPPLSWALADLLGAPITRRTNDWPQLRWINYYGPPYSLPSTSYYRVLDTNELGPGFFKNKVVFVGSGLITKFSGGRKDAYVDPYARWFGGQERLVSGVEIHANIFLNLMHETWLTRMARLREAYALIALGALFGFGLANLRPFFALFVGLLGMAAVAGLNYYLVVHTGVWFAWLIGVVEIAVAMLWSVVYNSVNLYVQKRLMQQSLAMYVSPAQVKRIIKQPDLLRPGATKHELSILFSDIANFTSMSEGMDSNELASFMNQYFEAAVGNCIQKTDGCVVKFIGDAIFAIWNAPESQSDHPERACRAALLLRDEVSAFTGTTKGKEVRTRIGLHCGVANVGNFGSSKRIDYTAIGENINLASRMEGLNKYLGTDILITGDVEQTVRGKFVTRFLGRFRLKGFEKAVAVYELLSVAGQDNGLPSWCAVFAESLSQFQKREFDAAEKGFQAVIGSRLKDGPSQYYLKQIEEARSVTLPADWSGEIEMHEK